MSFCAISRLSPAAHTGFQRKVYEQRVVSCKSIRPLLLVDSGFFHFLPRSTSLFSSSRLGGRRANRRLTMAASNSMPVLGDVYVDDFVTNCGNGVELTRHSGVYFTDRTQTSCQKASVSLRKREQSDRGLICKCLTFDTIRGNSSGGMLFGPLMKNAYTSSTMCFAAAGSARDLSFDGSSHHEQLSDMSTLSLQTLQLLSGSCYLPHPAKEEKGGEDAHFICEEEQAIGVADGVGGWAEVGVDAGEFSRQLMSNSVRAIKEEPKGSIHPYRVLEKAHLGANVKGSSTACIIALTKEGLHAINLGDSGFIVVRDGSAIFQSPVQQRGFNFPYQLGSGDGADLPSSGQVFQIPVDAGDVIVAGTDGLFDNLFNNEIAGVVVNSVRAGFSPQATAQKIAALARQRAVDSYRQTPFSAAAQVAGYMYYGGKLDDITVVVSYVASSM